MILGAASTAAYLASPEADLGKICGGGGGGGKGGGGRGGGRGEGNEMKLTMTRFD